MSLYIHKSHNVTVLLYHSVFPAAYRRAVFDAAVDQALRDVCLGIEARYQLKVLEIGTDRDHVHVLVQSVPTDSVTKLVMTIKSGLDRNPGQSLNRPEPITPSSLTAPGWVQERQLPAPPHKARQVRPVAPFQREKLSLGLKHKAFPPTLTRTF